jgi:type III restriction enzyme
MSNPEIRLRACQERAKNAIVADITAHLETYTPDSKERRFGFMAPTGSGKTLVMAKSIKEVAKQLNKQVAFIWLTPSKGELVEQSKAKLDIYLKQSGISVFFVHDAVLQPDLAGSVTVVGWDALNKEDKDGSPLNIAMRDGEKSSFPQVCEQTRNAGIPIVLLIDEVHHTAVTEKSLSIRNKHIQPAYTLEVSATPKYSSWGASTAITYEEAAKAHLIKKDIRQATFLSWQDGIRAGANKLQALLQLAASTPVDWNPRMIVFLPNANHEGGTELDQAMTLIEAEYGWTEASGDVVVWMSKRKSDNYEVCKDNTSTTKVIFTKEAIDTGIDIPSNQVQVHLRPMASTQVEAQKFGRGLRMPEQKHYGNDLDTLFLYLFNDYRLIFAGAELMKDMLERKTSFVRPEFAKSLTDFPAIASSFLLRKSPLLEMDEVDFAEIFSPIFATKLNDCANFNYDPSAYSEELKEGKLDLDTKQASYDTFVQATLQDDAIDNFYTARMRTLLKHVWKHLETIEDCIGSFRRNKGMDESFDALRTFILKNQSDIDRLIFEAIADGEAELEITKAKVKYQYHLPTDYCIDGEADVQYKKFLHDRYFLTRKGRSTIEIDFEQVLEKSSRVVWWMKNYDRQLAKSLSVPYTNGKGEEQNFFPDYIIALTDGSYIIGDTKSGNMDVNEKAKREALVATMMPHSTIKAGMIRQERDHFYLHVDANVVVALSTLL